VSPALISPPKPLDRRRRVAPFSDLLLALVMLATLSCEGGESRGNASVAGIVVGGIYVAVVGARCGHALSGRGSRIAEAADGDCEDEG
jgi:hypothetical protein